MKRMRHRATALIFAALLAPTLMEPAATNMSFSPITCYVTGSGCVRDAIVRIVDQSKGETDPDRIPRVMDDTTVLGDWTDSVHGEWTGAVQGRDSVATALHYPQTTAH